MAKKSPYPSSLFDVSMKQRPSFSTAGARYEFVGFEVVACECVGKFVVTLMCEYLETLTSGPIELEDIEFEMKHLVHAHLERLRIHQFNVKDHLAALTYRMKLRPYSDHDKL